MASAALHVAAAVVALLLPAVLVALVERAANAASVAKSVARIGSECLQRPHRLRHALQIIPNPAATNSIGNQME